MTATTAFKHLDDDTDFADVSATNAAFALTWDATNGVFKVTAS